MARLGADLVAERAAVVREAARDLVCSADLEGRSRCCSQLQQ